MTGHPCRRPIVKKNSFENQFKIFQKILTNILTVEKKFSNFSTKFDRVTKKSTKKGTPKTLKNGEGLYLFHQISPNNFKYMILIWIFFF